MTRSRVKRLLKTSPRVSPFLVIGDPTPQLSVELARAAVGAGADMIELGFPYSDPVADGPAIQAAAGRSLAGGTSTTQAIALLGRVHDAVPETPLNLLVYGNLVHARGFDRFCEEVALAGASTLLVPDIPLEESAVLKRACRKAGLGHVQLVGPLTSRERLARIDRFADSFVYLVAHQGVTGVRSGGFDAVEMLVARVANAVSNPLCLGFGLSKREQIERAFRAGARLAVVGSHLANVIGAVWADDQPGRDRMVVEAFSEALRTLTTPETGRKEEHAGHHA
ncbi:MAG TPA: tryptophan synthase subunit alpha [Vicinamibacteria bacterium]|nr:tryptophan synthase subunit alpha [Vicinamibacteria bacterium]